MTRYHLGLRASIVALPGFTPRCECGHRLGTHAHSGPKSADQRVRRTGPCRGTQCPCVRYTPPRIEQRVLFL